MTVLSRAEARRITLGAQGLIQPFDAPLDAVRAMVAVQTQYAASLPVAVAARLRKGKPGWEDAALVPGGSLIKSWSVRHTLHAHLPEDHALILGTIGPAFYQRHVSRMAEKGGLDMEALGARIEAALVNGPLTREALHAQVEELASIEYAGWGLDVVGLAFRRRLCVVGRGSSQAFALLEHQEAPGDLGRLFLRYVGAFGPASLRDFAHWVGITQQVAQAGVDSVRSEVEEVRVEGFDAPRFVLPDQPEVEGPLGVRLLAKFDPFTLAHRDKTWWLAEADRARVFRIAAQVEAVVLSQGIASATWRVDRKAKGATFTIEPFRPLRVREESGIEREAERLARRLGYGVATVVFKDPV